MEAQTAIKVIPITEEGIAFVNEEVKPKNKKGLIYFLFFFVALTILAPLLPGRHMHVKAFNFGDYFFGLMFYAIVSLVILGFLYYKTVYSLSQDLKEGTKLVFSLKVLRKSKDRYARYILVLDRQKFPSFDKIQVPKESHWNKGDTVSVEILKRSGTVLSYEKL